MGAGILDFVARQLFARDPAQFRRMDPVASEKSVQGAGSFVAIFAVIEHQDAPPRTSENRRSA